MTIGGPKPTQEDSCKAQARGEDAGSREALVVEKWSDSTRILKEKPTRFEGRLDVGFVRKKDATIFDLSTWKARAATDFPVLSSKGSCNNQMR